MIFNELNDDNYILFAIKYYNNCQSTTKEDFFNDLKRFKYVKRLLKKYHNSGELKTHLIINHVIILFNIFSEATIPLLFFKLEDELWPYLKSFLVFLNRVPEYPRTILNEIPPDPKIIEELNSLK